MIYLCPCIHKPKNNSIINTYEEWINYLKNKTKKFKNYDISLIYNDKMPDACPIIIGKYKKY